MPNSSPPLVTAEVSKIGGSISEDGRDTASQDSTNSSLLCNECAFIASQSFQAMVPCPLLDQLRWNIGLGEVIPRIPLHQSILSSSLAKPSVCLTEAPTPASRSCQATVSRVPRRPANTGSFLLRMSTETGFFSSR